MLSSLFQKWRRSRQTNDATENSSREQIRAWQKMLVEEHDRLGRELTDLLATYERSLNYFSAHVDQLDAAALQEECRSLESIRTVLGNAIRRLDVSTKDDQALQEEWQEWRALAETAPAPLTDTQNQRREMLRSELTIRGLLVAIQEERSPQDTPRETGGIMIAAEPPRERTIFVEESPDNFDDWHELHGRQLEAARTHWQEELTHALALAERDPIYAAHVLARVRAWHGQRKRWHASQS